MMIEKMPRAAKREVRRLLKGALAASSELMIEFVAKRRAANWGVINNGLYAAEQTVRSLSESKRPHRKGPKRAKR